MLSLNFRQRKSNLQLFSLKFKKFKFSRQRFAPVPHFQQSVSYTEPGQHKKLHSSIDNLSTILLLIGYKQIFFVSIFSFSNLFSLPLHILFSAHSIFCFPIIQFVNFSKKKFFIERKSEKKKKYGENLQFHKQRGYLCKFVFLYCFG